MIDRFPLRPFVTVELSGGDSCPNPTRDKAEPGFDPSPSGNRIGGAPAMGPIDLDQGSRFEER